MSTVFASQIMEKEGKQEKILLKNKDYGMFLKLVNGASVKKSAHNQTRGSDVTGSQFKHVFIGSNSDFAGGSIPAIAVTGIASVIYAYISSNDPYKLVVSYSTYEVLASAQIRVLVGSIGILAAFTLYFLVSFLYYCKTKQSKYYKIGSLLLMTVGITAYLFSYFFTGNTVGG